MGGVGDVLAGRVEQGVVKPGEEVIFLPTHTSSNPCTGKVFTVEMHHQRHDFANPGDNVGLNIKGLDKINMPRLVSCDAAALLAVSPHSNGKWARRPEARSWRIPTRSNPTRWLNALSSRSSLLCAILSKIAKVSPVLPSWMATAVSCWERLSLARGRRMPVELVARRSKWCSQVLLLCT